MTKKTIRVIVGICLDIFRVGFINGRPYKVKERISSSVLIETHGEQNHCKLDKPIDAS